MRASVRVLGCAALAACTLGVLAASGRAAGWPTCIERDAPIATGISESSRTRAGRVVTLTLHSTAMGGPQTVNVLLPEDYDASGRTRYPVLYLLHGAGGDNRSYLDEYDIEGLVGKLPLIVVMPDGSGPDATGVRRNGGYSDWFGVDAQGSGPAFAWESFHVRELVPFIDRSFPTLSGPAGRAIAGISMGGGGAMKYAAEYPGTFGYAGSFSGEVYPELPAAQAFQPKTCKFGDPATEEVVWRDNDATALAANLRGVRLFVRSGDGTPGPYDSAVPPADPTEALIRQQRLLTEYGAGLMARSFLDALSEAGVNQLDAEIYPGSHSRPYWQREMPEFIDWLADQLHHPISRQRSFSVRSAHRWFTAWGWTFAVRRLVREFVYVRVVRDRRLRVTGSGRIKVVTPPLFRPGRRYAIDTGRSTRNAHADGAGRLSFRLDLGPSHAEQQSVFDVAATASWKTVVARIGRP